MNITDQIAHEIPQWPAGHDVRHVVSGWEIKFHSPVFTVVVRSKVKNPNGIRWTGDMTKYTIQRIDPMTRTRMRIYLHRTFLILS